jgi:hypothetical protein
MSIEPPITPINLRFPADLSEAVRPVARENERSLHAEILWALRAYVARCRRARHEP